MNVIPNSDVGIRKTAELVTAARQQEYCCLLWRSIHQLPVSWTRREHKKTALEGREEVCKGTSELLGRTWQRCLSQSAKQIKEDAHFQVWLWCLLLLPGFGAKDRQWWIRGGEALAYPGRRLKRRRQAENITKKTRQTAAERKTCPLRSQTVSGEVLQRVWQRSLSGW